jgi:hypothetical protein
MSVAFSGAAAAKMPLFLWKSKEYVLLHSFLLSVLKNWSSSKGERIKSQLSTNYVIATPYEATGEAIQK